MKNEEQLLERLYENWKEKIQGLDLCSQGIEKARQEHKPEAGVSFERFAEIVVKNEVANFYRRNLVQK